MGLNEEFLKSISYGSAESKQYVEALVAGGAEAAKEVEAQWLATQAKKEEMATLVAETQTNFTEEMGKIKTEAETLATDLKNSTEFDEAGVAVVQGLIDGLASQMELLQAQVNAINAVLARVAISAFSISSTKSTTKPNSKATGLPMSPMTTTWRTCTREKWC